MSARIHELIGRYADGTASAAEVAELEAALRAGADIRKAFLRYMNVDTALTAAAPALRVVKSGTATPMVSRRSMRPVWAIAAAALVLFLAVAMLFRDRTAPPPAGKGTQATAFVTLAAANEAVWADPNVELALRAGELPPGVVRLESGTAEFLFADGATLVMRGPASVRFPARKRVTLESGKVFCRCPSPESRISVDTHATEIVDLGTEFAVEARPDRSTLVAVLSGEVRVGRTATRVLRKGEAVEVRGDGIMAIQPLAREDFAELLRSSPVVSDALQSGRNLLADPGFEKGLAEETWSGTEPNLEAVGTGGRSGAAVRIDSDGRAHWPQCRQRLETGDIAGRLVVATAWAAPDASPLQPRQSAVLKLVFVNEAGRDFAFAMRRFLSSASTPGRFEQAQVAAFAPPGTRRVQMQLMFQTHLRDTGAILFDDASLIIADAPAIP